MMRALRGVLFLPLVLTAPAPAAEGPVSFRKGVAPILVAKCLGCHGEKKASGGLNMATFAGLRRGGKSAGAEIIEAGDPEASVLIESVKPGASPRMPYKLPPLSDAEIGTLEAWVKQGARFDGPSETSTRLAALIDPLASLAPVPLKAAVSDPVSALAYSPDGATIAAASGRAVVVADAATGKPLRTLSGHPGPLTAVRFSPDGKALVAAGGRAGMFGSVTVWETGRWARAGEARDHADSVLAAELSPDGRTLATAGYDRTVVLWDRERLRPERALKDHTDSVYALAFARDGKTLASAGADRTVKLWDVATGRRLRTLSDATAELYAVAFSPDGSTVFAAGVDRSIRAWRVGSADAGLSGSVFAHDAAVVRLAVSPDGKTLVSAAEDRTVRAWDAATLAPLRGFGDQPDWPQALAFRPDGLRLAVGRHDGSVAVYEFASGKPLLAFAPAPPVTPPLPPKPELARNPSLNPPSPRGVARGKATRVTLTGFGAGWASEVVFSEPGLSARVVPPGKPDPNRLEVDVTAAPDARLGVHRVGLATPIGVTPTQPIAVEAAPAADEAEPNDREPTGKPISLPAVLAGTIGRPGDTDLFRVHVEEAAPLVFAMAARSLGSTLNGSMELTDPEGRTLAEATADEAGTDTLLTVTVPRAGDYTLAVSDADYEGSGNHFYRISAGRGAVVTEVFPLGVARDASTTVRVRGHGLGSVSEVAYAPPGGTRAGTVVDLPLVPPGGAVVTRPGRVVVGDGPQSVEEEPNDAPAGAPRVPLPGGVSGRIGREGDVDHVRFEGRKGERVIVEVFGRRLGTRVDPFVEVLDADGRPVPRAVLRPVAETEVAFRDHGATGPGVRLTKWNNLAVGDVVLFGREVTRIFALPRNPDDDCQLWSEQGARVGLLETTPEHHPMGQPIYKVEVHPPGSTFPAGGQPPVVVTYRNDDGGPGFARDARVTFDPPADGTYVARVGDTRGLGGEGFGYHLVLRRPRPDFTASVSPADPSIPRGSTAVVTVSITRLDGFDAPVLFTADHLPAGVTATPALVEAGASTATLALTADPSAAATSPPTWTLTAASVGSPEALSHEVDPGGPGGGRVTVTGEPNLRVEARPGAVAIRPGGFASLTLAVERGPAFKGRVPIDVRNLPHGVRVLDVGLNGVLVTEKQTERTIRLYAEPWVKPVERPFYAVGRAEAAGTEHSSDPVTLAVRPAAGAPEPTARAGR